MKKQARQQKGISLILFACSVFTCISIFFLSAGAVPEQRVFDNAGLFTDEERQSLQEQLESLEAETALYVSILTEDDFGSNPSDRAVERYVDDFYDETFSINTDGIILLLNNDGNSLWNYISTSGHAIRIFTDSRIQTMLDGIVALKRNQAYYDAAVKFCTEVSRYAAMGVPSGQANYDTETGEVEYYKEKEPLAWYAYTGIGLAVGLVLSLIVVLSVHSRYKIKSAKHAADYLDKSSVHFTQRTDTFIHRNISKVRIERNNSHGGGGSFSSTHTSSGGGTHGGGGARG